MDNKEYLDKIKNMLWETWHSKELEYKEFCEIKNKVEGIYEESKDPEALWILSELYIHKENFNKLEGKEYSLKGLEEDYNHVGLHDNFNICAGGIEVDFKKRNHNKVISYYYDFIKIHPDSLIARRLLIENLIDNYRLEEALKEIFETYKIVEDDKRFLIEIYEGEVLFRKGRNEEALRFFEELLSKNKDNYRSYALFADQCANFALYEEALKYYKISFDMQKEPRRIDALISIFQINEIKRDYKEAIKTLDLILEVFEKDYKIIDGEEIKSYLLEKERINKILEFTLKENS